MYALLKRRVLKYLRQTKQDFLYSGLKFCKVNYFFTLFGNDVNFIEYIGFLNLCDINYIKPLLCKVKQHKLYTNNNICVHLVIFGRGYSELHQRQHFT